MSLYECMQTFSIHRKKVAKVVTKKVNAFCTQRLSVWIKKIRQHNVEQKNHENCDNFYGKKGWLRWKMQLIDRHTEKQTNDYYLSSTPCSYGSHCSTKQLNRIASSATSFGTCSHIIACVLGSCQRVWGTARAPPQVPARPQRLLLQRQVFQGRDSQHPQSNQKLTEI